VQQNNVIAETSFYNPLSNFNRLNSKDYRMATVRSHGQFNTTIYVMNDRYRGVFNERRVFFMNEKDIEKGNFEPGKK
jgi:anaerobic selenocysteine-containing dehydrogenase